MHVYKKVLSKVWSSAIGEAKRDLNSSFVTMVMQPHAITVVGHACAYILKSCDLQASDALQSLQKLRPC